MGTKNPLKKGYTHGEFTKVKRVIFLNEGNRRERQTLPHEFDEDKYRAQ